MVKEGSIKKETIKKEIIKKETIKKKSPKKAISKEDIQKALVDNFISLQKVMANLSLKFDELSTNISKLLQLFEVSAKTFAEKYSGEELSNLSGAEVNSEFIKKLDELLNQNKIISRGIMLIEEKLRNKNDYPEQTMPPSQQRSLQGQMQYRREMGARQGFQGNPKPPIRQ